jgi:hypothetical protein
MITALIIVHLHSLDSYRAQEGRDAAEHLAGGLIEGILDHKGPVYLVIDPDGDDTMSSVRRRIMKEIAGRPVIVFPYGDEYIGDWDKLFKELKAQMKKDQVDEVHLGGIWYYENKKTGKPKKWPGCVNAVYWWLKKKMRMVVWMTDLVGQEGDGDEYTT